MEDTEALTRIHEMLALMTERKKNINEVKEPVMQMIALVGDELFDKLWTGVLETDVSRQNRIFFRDIVQKWRELEKVEAAAADKKDDGSDEEIMMRRQVQELEKQLKAAKAALAERSKKGWQVVEETDEHNEPSVKVQVPKFKTGSLLEHPEVQEDEEEDQHAECKEDLFVSCALALGTESAIVHLTLSGSTWLRWKSMRKRKKQK
eukprot:TRINITY_DN79520_c0_g1_i1.p1 TRINITY_DN79520_c0_g1~~TRINITY_DN79520_c0_g1_i1.p1  ORF type:complete len:206 (+),score=45.34 TRINITY_DN79520_c0_g1_i1:90-707(+)